MYQNAIKLTFHTRDAELLYQGGDGGTKEFIPSFRFTRKRINDLYAMALKENPYAEAALIELDYRLEEIADLASSVKVISRNCIKKAEQNGIHVRLLTNDSPYQHDIDFITEYTVYMARMLTEVDDGFRYVRTAHHTTELPTETAKTLIVSLRRNTRMFYDRTIAYAKRIQPGITRDDIEQKTAKAQTMIGKFGVPSKAILNRDMTYKGQRISELGFE